MNRLDFWYKLDNVAKLFPAVTTKKNSSTFRVSVILYKEIDPDILQLSLDSVILRFPMFNVRMRRGFFWYFLETNDEKLLVQKEEDAPCGKINRFRNNNFLLRVLYYNKRISVEFFHSITDGYGAMEFLKVLVYKYLRNMGNEFNNDLYTYSVADSVNVYEKADSFKEYYNPKEKFSNKGLNAYKIKGELFNNFGNNVVKILFDLDKFKGVIKKYNTTVTVYVVALFAYSINLERSKKKLYDKPISIVVPINLRQFFESKSLRNFFTVANITISCNENDSFEKILEDVSLQFRNILNKEYLVANLSQNFKNERYFFIKLTPLFLKNIILKLAFYLGTKKQTASVSNIGKISLPDEIINFIDNMEIILYSSRENVINCGVCSIGSKLAITFARTIHEPNIINTFVKMINDEDIGDINVFSNQWEII